MNTRLHASLCLLLLTLAGSGYGQRSIATGMMEIDSGLTLDLSSVFDPLPNSGMVPVKVSVSNERPQDVRWHFSFHSKSLLYPKQHEHQSRFTIESPAGQKQSATFLVPLSVAYGASHTSGLSYHHEFRMIAEVPGIANREYPVHERSIMKLPCIAISPALALTSHAKLKVAHKSIPSLKGSHDGFGSEFSLSDLPEDWRGLSGFDFLMMTVPEWLSLRPAQRLAVVQWARLGRVLDLYHPPPLNPAAAQLPTIEQNGKHTLSLGEVRFFPWNGMGLEPISTVRRYADARPYSRHSEILKTAYAQKNMDWPLRQQLGQAHDGAWQVMLFLVIFGILVGPVNLFVLAPSHRRHRLLITTPLISALATALLCLIILLQDGVGGRGLRFALVNLQPEEATAYVTQEQICRTGVLTHSSFESLQPMILEPVALPPSAWVRLTQDTRTGKMTLNQEGKQSSGTYFQSRSEQAHLLRAAVPTRARVEWKAGLAADAAPELISTLKGDLEQVFCADAAGQLWCSTQPLRTGQSVKLKKCSMSDLRSKLKDITDQAGGHLQRRFLAELLHLDLVPGTFIATSQAPPAEFTLESLPSIEWQKSYALFLGPVLHP